MRRCGEGFDGLNQPVVIKRLIVLSSTQIISCAGSRGARHHVEITQMLSLSSPVDRHTISVWCGGSLTYVCTPYQCQMTQKQIMVMLIRCCPHYLIKSSPYVLFHKLYWQVMQQTCSSHSSPLGHSSHHNW